MGTFLLLVSRETYKEQVVALRILLGIVLMTKVGLEGWVFISGEVKVSRGGSDDQDPMMSSNIAPIKLLSWRE